MWQEWLQFAIAMVIAVIGAIAVALMVTGAMRLFVRRRQWPASLITRARRPFRAFVLVIALWIAIAVTFPDPAWKPALNHAMTIVTIIVGAWLVGRWCSSSPTSLSVGTASTCPTTGSRDGSARRR
ncbi:hypothetical protein [Microbacterium sp. SLBN-154]|uniref:hypothetical protein n=1 Tax=Microbacterium sp. SLBN-154 TaxID=2768458 RepID=UPI001F17050D|nr:hypothetical protein [Microbacterium sp. SLBN-154]